MSVVKQKMTSLEREQHKKESSLQHTISIDAHQCVDRFAKANPSVRMTLAEWESLERGVHLSLVWFAEKHLKSNV